MRKLALPLLLIIVAVSIGVVFSKETNRVAFFDRHGFITRGKRFGIAIGEPSSQAEESLRAAQWEYSESKYGGTCLKRDYDTDTQVAAFTDGTWRRIALCLGEREGRVVSVQWYSMFLMPEL